MEQTWLSTLKTHGSKHGYARYAELISRGLRLDADDAPEKVVRDPKVVAAYLGTDEE